MRCERIALPAELRPRFLFFIFSIFFIYFSSLKRRKVTKEETKRFSYSEYKNCSFLLMKQVATKPRFIFLQSKYDFCRPDLRSAISLRVKEQANHREPHFIFLQSKYDFYCLQGPGASDGNRTRVTGLGSRHSTIELHSHLQDS